MGTNAGAPVLAFQEWRHFKEAYTPELVARAVAESTIRVRRCLDPFGGSGTTALACQFLGVHPITAEVNPFLADLIEAKLTTYDADAMVRDLGRVLRMAVRNRESARLILPASAPSTMVEPGSGGRWIFDAEVGKRLGALREAISAVNDERHQRLLRVLLGGILLGVSNVVVNGKGRRYRRNWKEYRADKTNVEQLFSDAVRLAVTDIHQFSNRKCLSFDVIRGDARHELSSLPTCDAAIFSPPYPNSFDYTDVYNIELWALGYLDGRAANRTLRQSTLCSHVQIDRTYPQPPLGSKTLKDVLNGLSSAREKLWHRQIPAMVGGYFADLISVISGVRSILHEKGKIWMVVGDSRYADVVVPTAQILRELASSAGLRVSNIEPFRSMRASAQQGGQYELSESLLIMNPSP